jgi:hypothetical protein
MKEVDTLEPPLGDQIDHSTTTLSSLSEVTRSNYPNKSDQRASVAMQSIYEDFTSP